MKILLIHNSYANFGGEDRVFEMEYHGLVKVLGKANVFKYVVTSKDITAGKLLSILFSRKYYQAVYDLVKQEQIDIVHIHNFFPLLTGSIFKAAKNAGAKVVHTLHNYRWWCVKGDLYRDNSGICTLCLQQKSWGPAVKHRCYRNSHLQSLAAGAAFDYYKRSGVLAAVDRFFVLTAFQRQEVLSLGLPPSKVILKPNWVESAQELPATTKSGFVFVGRLELSKGIETLLTIWETLPRHLHLTVIGTGSLEQTLRERFSHLPNVLFKGALSPSNTLLEMAGAAFSIQPSLLYETFGLTIIESMQAGVPVIGLNIGTRTELIQHGVNGYLCELDDLKQTVIQAAAMNGYQELSTMARLTAEKFKQEKILQEQLRHYQDLLQANN